MSLPEFARWDHDYCLPYFTSSNYWSLFNWNLITIIMDIFQKRWDNQSSHVLKWDEQWITENSLCGKKNSYLWPVKFCPTSGYGSVPFSISFCRTTLMRVRRVPDFPSDPLLAYCQFSINCSQLGTCFPTQHCFSSGPKCVCFVRAHFTSLCYNTAALIWWIIRASHRTTHLPFYMGSEFSSLWCFQTKVNEKFINWMNKR